MSHPSLVRRALPCALALSLGAGLLIGPASPASAAIVPNPIAGSVADPGVALTPIATYESGVFGQSAAEIVTHFGSKIFTVNAVDGTVDVLDAAPTALTKSATLSLVGAPIVGGGSIPAGAAANSLVVRADGLGVVAVQNPVKTDAGWLVAFDADSGSLLSAVTVGALPDMVTLTEDGAHALVANEGEPSADFTVDPEGSVAVVALPTAVAPFAEGAVVRTADFHDFEVGGAKRAQFDERTRVFGPAPHGDDLPVSRNLEPEYISVSGGKAYVALQEANAIGVLDIATAEFERVWSLGLKDHSLEQNSLTTSNQANRATNPRQDALLRERHTYENLSGLYMPDGIDSYTVGGETYLVTANEGDAREWGEYTESVRVADLPPKDDDEPHGYGPVCADVFTTEQLSAPYLGRLNVSIESPFDAERGCYTELHAFGARSFSIYKADGTQVFDSGDDFETITAELFPQGFNTTNDENTLGNRNDDKGPEPENVTIAQLEGRTYAFVGLERVGGIMTYDITDPAAPEYVSYINNRDFAGAIDTPAAGDLGPEGVHFIPAGQSVTGRPMLAVGNETSGSTTLFDIETSTTTIQVLGINDFHGHLAASLSSGEIGAAGLAGAFEAFRAENPNTLVLSAGDNIGGSPFISSSQQDDPTIDALVAAGVQTSVVGNHEFDRGFADLTDRVIPRYAAASGTDGADFALGANVYRADGVTPALKEYSLQTIDGVRVAVIGTVTESTPSVVNKAGIQGLVFGDAAEAANRVAAEITAADAADLVIHVTHEGAEPRSSPTLSDAEYCAQIENAGNAFGEIVTTADPAIDAIVSAHSHQRYDCEIDGRPVVQALEYGKYLNQLEFTIDRASGEVVATSTEQVQLVKPGVPASGGNTAIPAVANYPDVPRVAEIVAAAKAESDVIGSVEIGSVSADILRARSGEVVVRTDESAMGNFIADVQLWATSAENPEYGGEQPSEIAIMNPGGLREDILFGTDGSVTYGEVAVAQPFANSLFTMDLTGAQLDAVLEEQWAASRGKLHLGLSANVDYVVDPAAALGAHISQVEVDGELLGAADTVRVTTNSFLANGGDLFTTLASGTQRADSGIVDLDALVTYFETVDEACGVVNPSAVGRARLAGTEPVRGQVLSIENECSTGNPGAGNPGTGNPGTGNPGNPGIAPQKPTTAPAAVADTALTAALESTITSDDRSLSAGQTIEVFVGQQYAGQWVQVWLHSEPVLLGGGWLQVDAAGYVTVELPDELPAGAHRLVVLDADGDVIGWQSVTVADTGVAGLADTGAQVAPVLVLASLMLAAGAVLVIARRRRSQLA